MADWTVRQNWKEQSMDETTKMFQNTNSKDPLYGYELIVPEAINRYNVYRQYGSGSNKNLQFMGMGDEITLPSLEALTTTTSGPGILGEIESPLAGQYGSLELGLNFKTINQSNIDLLTPKQPMGISIRANQQNLNRNSGITMFSGLRIFARGRVKTFENGTLKQGDSLGSSMTLELHKYQVSITLPGASRKNGWITLLQLDKLKGYLKLLQRQSDGSYKLVDVIGEDDFQYDK